MKVAVIGGGSSYTPELINGFLERVSHFPLTELWLMDVLPERLEIVGQFAQRMVQAKGSPFQVHLTTNQREAVAGASYVTTQLRVGWMQARREDEYLGRRHGLVGQETTGIGGMAKALRTIPVILKLAEDMRELAPGALLVNFTNPAGLVTQALSQLAPDVPSVGVCNAPIGMKLNVLRELKEMGIEVEEGRAQLDTLGLNHLSWHRGFTVDGEDVWPRVLEQTITQLQNDPNPEWDWRTIEALRMIPNYYLHYFYHTAHKLAEQEQWPPSRAEAVMKIEEGLFAQYAEPERTEPPEGLMQRGGAYYSTVATQLLNAHYNDLGETHVVNVAHRGAVPGWPGEWVLELPCKVSRGGIEPIPTRPLPPACFGLLAQIKMFELLTVDAAATGNRQAAYQALLTHPLGPSADKVQTVLDDLLATHRPYLPQFWG
ncbi:MAG: 6-phospho-beta-glucosidase [Chloroflexi bacterium]|nr:6-phospho-beta-glucosidase [Chloroflexota bacterium]MBP8055290.1 6-phospho-beta-glucosidase [Chloroflexota bacterium]